MSEVNERDTVATLRRMADVTTSALYSQRMALHDAADLIERLQAENAKLTVACAAYELEAAGLREQLASARNTALDEACGVIDKTFSEGSKIPSSTVPLFTGLRAAIGALKVTP